MRGGLTVLLVAGIALGVAGCTSKEPQLMHAKANTPTVGPDEFGLVPNRPLQDPPDPKALPVPTPGLANLADADPTGDALKALGGRASAERGVARNSPLMVAVTRFGTDPNIRSELAAEDLQFRRDHSGKFFEKLLQMNVYNKAYTDQVLDPWAMRLLLIQRGIATPAAPPKP